MSAAEAIEFAGTDEELEKILAEFARATDGWVGRSRKTSEWAAAGGRTLSTNPNTMAWCVEVTRAEGGLKLTSEGGPLIPWLRAKGDRIGAFRLGQLKDYLTTRIRGGGPEKFDAARLRAPFSPFGSGPAALTASFAWATICLIGALVFSLLATTIASYFLMNVSIGEIVERAAAIRGAGGIGLPGEAEAGSIGFGFRLGCALLFAFPLAFFVGTLHALALVIGEATERASWVPQWTFMIIVFSFLMALWNFLPFYLVIPLAFLVPLGTHIGYTLPLSLRRERVREEAPGGKRAVVAGIILTGVVVMLFSPGFATGEQFTDRLSLFRDRWMLGNAPGKEAAEFYYRYTLYTADPLKQFYAMDGSAAQRRLRTARLDDSADAALFRELDFTVVDGPADVRWGDGVLRSGDERVALEGKLDESALRPALHKLASRTFRGGMLRELYSIAWYSVYLTGPVVVALVVIGGFCPFISILFRKLTRKRALAALGIIFVSSIVVIAITVAGFDGDALRTLSRTPTPEVIARELENASWAARHEAAYRAYRLERVPPALVDPLVRACSDEDLRVRIWACGALGRSGDSRALKPLLDRLEDSELFVRYRAAEGLGHLRNRRAIDALKKMIREGIWYEGKYAHEALRRIDPERF